MSTQEKKSYILHELRRYECRITSQRQMLIDIILQDECCTCKEIYHQTVKSGPTMGIATIYHMIRTLEEVELIRRRNPYQIQCGRRSV